MEVKGVVLNQDSTAISGSGNVQHIGISEKDTVKLAQILRGGIYDNRIMAFIRELLTNAQDANRQTPNASQCIVTLPSQSNLVFSVRDFGPGMTLDKFQQVYMQYGFSTKEADDSANGYFGVGSKSPFGYTPTYSVKVFSEGFCRHYILSTSRNNLGEITLVSSEKTDQPSGLLVEVPVNPTDISKVEAEFMHVATYLEQENTVKRDDFFATGVYKDVEELRNIFGNGFKDLEPFIINDVQVSAKAKFVIKTKISSLRTSHRKHLEDKYNEGMVFVVSAGVAYPIKYAELLSFCDPIDYEDEDFLSEDAVEVFKLISHSHVIVLRMPNGTVLPNVSRESINFSSESLTKNFIRQALRQLFETEITKVFNKFTSGSFIDNVFEVHRDSEIFRLLAGKGLSTISNWVSKYRTLTDLDRLVLKAASGRDVYRDNDVTTLCNGMSLWNYLLYDELSAGLGKVNVDGNYLSSNWSHHTPMEGVKFDETFVFKFLRYTSQEEENKTVTTNYVQVPVEDTDKILEDLNLGYDKDAENVFGVKKYGYVGRSEDLPELHDRLGIVKFKTDEKEEKEIHGLVFAREYRQNRLPQVYVRHSRSHLNRSASISENCCTHDIAWDFLYKKSFSYVVTDGLELWQRRMLRFRSYSYVIFGTQAEIDYLKSLPAIANRGITFTDVTSEVVPDKSLKPVRDKKHKVEVTKGSFYVYRGYDHAFDIAKVDDIGDDLADEDSSTLYVAVKMLRNTLHPVSFTVNMQKMRLEFDFYKEFRLDAKNQGNYNRLLAYLYSLYVTNGIYSNVKFLIAKEAKEFEQLIVLPNLVFLQSTFEEMYNVITEREFVGDQFITDLYSFKENLNKFVMVPQSYHLHEEILFPEKEHAVKGFSHTAILGEYRAMLERANSFPDKTTTLEKTYRQVKCILEGAGLQVPEKPEQALKYLYRHSDEISRLNSHRKRIMVTVEEAVQIRASNFYNLWFMDKEVIAIVDRKVREMLEPKPNKLEFVPDDKFYQSLIPCSVTSYTPVVL